MDDAIRETATRRATLLAAGAALVSGCSGLTSEAGDTARRDEGATATHDGSTVTPGSTTPADEWNATVDLDASKTSMASEKWIYNGWNVSVEVTSIDGADQVVYVLEQVNVVEGNATRESVVGSEVGATHSRSLLQRGDRISVYAVKGDERKRIDAIEINSSYVAPADDETSKWSDSWRGEPPETET